MGSELVLPIWSDDSMICVFGVRNRSVKTEFVPNPPRLRLFDFDAADYQMNDRKITLKGAERRGGGASLFRTLRA